MSLELQPITFKEASEYITEHHRHHKPPVSWKFGIAVNDGENVVGVITVGRPVSRHLDNGWTAEVNRCCTDGTKNASSMLYSAAWRAARAMGYRRLITYTLVTEPGASMRAAGWKAIGETAGGSWSCKSRPRVDTHPLGQKTLWEQK
uniref:N-acetyltransferase domain-containing protein n=1 Tax=viral metagenome TaxID=1070528 RepID=A0A6M3KJ56_9ZZZZ